MEPRDTNGAYYSEVPAPIASNKRGREDDDGEEEVKRQKTDTGDGGPVGGSPYNLGNRPIIAHKSTR